MMRIMFSRKTSAGLSASHRPKGKKQAGIQIGNLPVSFDGIG
jgi:hypothetical protein